jgi:hypothetical protein
MSTFGPWEKTAHGHLPRTRLGSRPSSQPAGRRSGLRALSLLGRLWPIQAPTARSRWSQRIKIGRSPAHIAWTKPPAAGAPYNPSPFLLPLSRTCSGTAIGRCARRRGRWPAGSLVSVRTGITNMSPTPSPPPLSVFHPHVYHMQCGGGGWIGSMAGVLAGDGEECRQPGARPLPALPSPPCSFFPLTSLLSAKLRARVVGQTAMAA